MAHDKHLEDSERAHSGKPGSKVRHGADATGKVGPQEATYTIRSGNLGGPKKVVKASVSAKEAAKHLELGDDVFESSMDRKGKAWNEDLYAKED